MIEVPQTEPALSPRSLSLVMRMLLALVFLTDVLKMHVDAFAVLNMGSATEKGAVIAVVGATGQLDCSTSYVECAVCNADSASYTTCS
jgi:hypothetical protein